MSENTDRNGSGVRENRVPIMMSDAELRAVDDWRFANRVATRSEAIRRLVVAGCAATDMLEALLAHEAALTHLESFEPDMNPDRHCAVSDGLFSQAEALSAAAISKATSHAPTSQEREPSA